MPPQAYDTSDLLEYTWEGPFVGLSDQIDQKGFYKAQNVVFNNGFAYSLPNGLLLQNVPDSNLIQGIYDFDPGGPAGVTVPRVQVALTKAHLYYFTQPSTWTAVTGTLNAGINDSYPFSFAVVNNKLLFSEGLTVVQLWDGSSASFSAAAAAAVPAFYLCEFYSYLLCGYTYESGTYQPQRIRWTGPGAPTDWTSFASGFQDLQNNLGYVTGIQKLGIYAYAFQTNGMTLINPTGVGTAPFQFTPFADKGKGCTFPQSIANFGGSEIIYANFHTIWHFDGTNWTDLLSSASRSLKNKILFFLNQQNFLNPVFGAAFYESSTFGDKSYYLTATGTNQNGTGLGGVFRYSFKEDNWSQILTNTSPYMVVPFYYGGTSSPQPVYFSNLGPIPPGQSFTNNTQCFNIVAPYSLIVVSRNGAYPAGAAPVLLGASAFVRANGGTLSSESPLIVSNTDHFGDRMHQKTVEGVRIIYHDLTSILTSFTFTLTNEKLQTATFTVPSLGTGSGLVLEVVYRFKLNGLSFSWQLSSGGYSGLPALKSLSLLYTTGSNYKNN